jgi:hypothetical protein
LGRCSAISTRFLLVGIICINSSRKDLQDTWIQKQSCNSADVDFVVEVAEEPGAGTGSTWLQRICSCSREP